EFYQCDVDALGSTSPAVEAELCAAVADALLELGFPDFTIRINHRALLTAVLRALGIDDADHASALVVLDKLDKVGLENASAEWLAKGGTIAAAVDGLRRAFEPLAPGPNPVAQTWQKLDELEALIGEPGRPAVENLRAIRALASAAPAGTHLA